MAFPAIQNVTETADSADATDHNVSMPATVNDGDLLIALLSVNEGAAVTTPSGWTQLDHDVEAGEITLAEYAKEADGTEGGTTVNFVTDSSQKLAAQVYRITGWRNSGTLTSDVEVGVAVQAVTGTPDPPSLNPTNWDVEDTLWLAIYGARNSTALIDTIPANYTDGIDTVSTGGANGTNNVIASARRENATATEDPGTFDIAGADRHTITQTIAIRPAAAVGTAIRDVVGMGVIAFPR